MGTLLCAGCSRPASPPQPQITHPAYDPTLVPKEVATLTESVKQDPKGAIAFGNLSAAYLKLYRQTGEIQQAMLAEQAARRSLAIRTKRNEIAYLRLAQSLNSQHRFTEAFQAAKKATELLPRYQDAGLLCAEIALEQGDYDIAQNYWRRFAPSPPSLGSKAMEARMLWLNGSSEKSLSAYQEALAGAEKSYDISNESLAWFYWKTGECFENMGRGKEAEVHYKSALQHFPADYRVLNAMTRLMAERKDWQGVLECGKRAVAIVPSPETIGLLGDAYNALGQPKQGEREFRLLDNISRLNQKQGNTYDRQRALFLSDHRRHLGEALQLAQNELKIRHDVYAYDTLAWCLYQNGRLTEAKQAMRKALARGTKERRFQAHAKKILAGRE